MKIAIIGGGAAGFFAAINAKENFPSAEVSILEKTSKTLSKVKISGGGRCNVTNGTMSRSELLAAYPRGGSLLKKLFKIFDNKNTFEWFESKGVSLKIEDDLRAFPESNSSQTIIDCFMAEVDRLGISLELSTAVLQLKPEDDKIKLAILKQEDRIYDKVIIATGGSPKLSGFQWLADLGHQISIPVPSLFTFNMPKHPITALMGVSVPNAIVTIQGTKLKSKGPLLITHWGMSGPAILKLSAFGARVLKDKNYDFKINVNWIGDSNHELVFEDIEDIRDKNPKKYLVNIKPFQIPMRLWEYILNDLDLDPNRLWQDLGKKSINKIVTHLIHDEYVVSGKTTFKEEFVTSGGVILEDINPSTMESKILPNVYFAGEVIDVDGVTGGFNFQAAWTTAFVASELS